MKFRVFVAHIRWNTHESKSFPACVFMDYPTPDEISDAVNKAFPDWRKRAQRWHLAGIHSEQVGNYICPADKAYFPPDSVDLSDPEVGKTEE